MSDKTGRTNQHLFINGIRNSTIKPPVVCVRSVLGSAQSLWLEVPSAQ